MPCSTMRPWCKHHDARGQHAYRGKIVGYDDRRRPERLGDTLNHVEQIGLNRRIESGRRFVEQQDLRWIDQRPCELHPLLHSAGERHQRVGVAFRLQAELTEQFGCARVDLAEASRAAAEKPFCDVRLGGQPGVKPCRQGVLMHHDDRRPLDRPSAHRNRSRFGGKVKMQTPQQRGLPRSRLADDPEHLMRPDIERRVKDRDNRAAGGAAICSGLLSGQFRRTGHSPARTGESHLAPKPLAPAEPVIRGRSSRQLRSTSR